jgi:dTDP-4-dehydrorhamnose 3,5-epimerase
MTTHHALAVATSPHESQIPVLLSTRRHADARGWFVESYNARTLAQHGIACDFVQDNQSLSRRKGTIRGLHFQLAPKAQAKLVRVVRGSIYDVAVDIRRNSPTYGRSVGIELSADNGWQLYVPVGFAHGFCTLEDDTEVAYKVSEFYSPQHDAGLRWDDPDIDVAWPVAAADVVVSDKDAAQPRLAEFTGDFSYHGEPLAPLLIKGIA